MQNKKFIDYNRPSVNPCIIPELKLFIKELKLPPRVALALGLVAFDRLAGFADFFAARFGIIILEDKILF